VNNVRKSHPIKNEKFVFLSRIHLQLCVQASNKMRIQFELTSILSEKKRLQVYILQRLFETVGNLKFRRDFAIFDDNLKLC